MPHRSIAFALCAAALVACSGGALDPVAELEQSSYGYITCDDLIIWRADYSEIGEGSWDDAELGDVILDPDPTPFIGQLRCPPPSGYVTDTDLVVINLYWSPNEYPDAAMPDAWVFADAAVDAGDAYDGPLADAGDAGPFDAAVDAGDAYDGPLADAGPVDAGDARYDAGGDAGGQDAYVLDAGGGGDAGGDGHDGGVVVADASVTYGNAPGVFMFPPPPPGKPVQPRPVIPVKPGPPVTQIPLPPGATKPPPRVVEPQAMKNPGLGPPRFIDPVAAIEATAKPAYRAQLWTDLLLLDPIFGIDGTQVHMGMWSGNQGKNEAALRVLLNDINTNGGPKVRGFFDEGLGGPTQVLPSYKNMSRENWYGRGKLVDGKGSLEPGGPKIIDPKPTTFNQADLIWGQYSQRYAQMALDANAATGKVVDVWCFVENAAIDRVFYKYELPVLKDLETLGVVRVHFAKKLDAKYNNPADWTHGTANAPPAGPPVNPPPLGPP